MPAKRKPKTKKRKVTKTSDWHSGYYYGRQKYKKETEELLTAMGHECLIRYLPQAYLVTCSV